MNGKYKKERQNDPNESNSETPPPNLEWPSDLLPGIPEYGNDGRIIDVQKPSSGYKDKVNVNVIIGETTPEAFAKYCDKVLQAGWILNSLWTEEELKSGKGGSLKKEGYDFTLEFGRNNDGTYSIESFHLNIDRATV